MKRHNFPLDAGWGAAMALVAGSELLRSDQNFALIPNVIGIPGR